jgi:hypothetical protein
MWEWASAFGLWMSPSKAPSLWLCALSGLLLLTASPWHRSAWRALYVLSLLVFCQALLFAGMTARANTYPSPLASWYSSICTSTLASMLPRDASTLTPEEGFAVFRRVRQRSSHQR